MAVTCVVTSVGSNALQSTALTVTPLLLKVTSNVTSYLFELNNAITVTEIKIGSLLVTFAQCITADNSLDFLFMI